MICRLCASEADPFMTVGDVRYGACGHCGLRFMDQRDLPSEADEKAHYDQHENLIDDQGYRDFLAQVSQPLNAALPKPSKILDFGAGPGPALAMMMSDHGHDVSIYDPFYAPDRSVLSQSYDAVMATEVVEHFHNPNDGFAQMIGLLRPSGILAVMTNLQDNDDAFANWYYRRDPTHVAFYREETLQFIGQKFGLAAHRVARNVTFFKNLKTMVDR